MMESLFTYLLEFSIGSMALYVYYVLAWKNNRAFDLRRFVLLAILTLSVLFPFISIQTKELSPLVESFQLNSLEIVAGNKGLQSSAFNWNLILLSIYFTGVFLSLLQGIKGIWQIIRIRLSSEIKFKDDHNFVSIKGSFPTFSFLNTLYWNDEIPLDSQDREMIYSHELTHIRQFHSLDLIFISICRILFWFNPIVHLFYKEMALIHECIADREVLKSYSPVNYLSLLANQTIYNMQYQWINQFASVSSFKRMRAIKNAKNSSVAIRLFLIVPLIAILITTISCENSVESADQNMEANKSEIVSDAEEMPSFVGGMEAMITYLSGSIEYPEIAKKEGIEGKVFVSFVVEKDGSITNAEIVKGVNPVLDDEALRVVESMPKWNAGTKDGEKVRTKMTLPIVFTF